MRFWTSEKAFIQRSMGASTSVSIFDPVSFAILANSSLEKSIPPMGEMPEGPTGPVATGTTLPPPVSSKTRGSDEVSTTLEVTKRPSVATLTARISFSTRRRCVEKDIASFSINSLRVFWVVWKSLSPRPHFWRVCGRGRGRRSESRVDRPA